MVELGSGISLPCPDDRVPESLVPVCLESQYFPGDYDLALLPVLSVATTDAMIQIIFVGKAVMKEVYLKILD